MLKRFINWVGWTNVYYIPCLSIIVLLSCYVYGFGENASGSAVIGTLAFWLGAFYPEFYEKEQNNK